MILLVFLLQVLWGQILFASSGSLEALDKLLLNRNTPKDEKVQCIEDILPYIKNIEYQTNVDVIFRLPLIKEGYSATYFPFNPSIIKTDQGYDVVCRAANVKLGVPEPCVPGELRNNKIFFLRYDKFFNLLYEQEIPIPRHLQKKINSNNQLADQIADCRTFHANGATWFTGWCFPGKPGIQKFVLGKFNCNSNDIPEAIQSLTIFFGPQADRWEKNWMPIVQDNSLKLIYSYDPFVLIEPNIENGEYQIALTYTPELDFSNFRGSAAPIEFQNGYLMMVHEVLNKKYVHRFLYLDKNFIITKLSLPFTFTHMGIEFCLAMTIDHSGKNLIIPIGIRDEQAKILITNLEYVKQLLFEVPH